ncbi:MAG: hypothetical protein C0483_22910 [Pirellula sp.]|nr:hypothetical protein [Pirellula sp.]
MRSAGSTSNQHDAATFVDYLMTLGITAKAERSGDAWDVWIFDEDQLPRGRTAFAEFQADPQADRYRDAAKIAEQIRTVRLERELSAHRLATNAPRPLFQSTAGKRPLTMALLTMCGVCFLLTSDNPDPTVLNEFRITALEQIDSQQIRWYSIPEIRAGQVWRLVTPIFLHFGLPHLVFNMLCLVDFGTQIELKLGWKRMLAMVLLFSIPGNFAQYYFDGPMFGGFSGVLFGMFGYIGMKVKFEPWTGLFLQPLTVMLLAASFVLGFAGLFPMCHWCNGIGLALGLALGYAPTMRGKLRGEKL